MHLLKFIAECISMTSIASAAATAYCDNFHFHSSPFSSLISVPESHFKLNYRTDYDSMVHIKCSAFNVYPEPKLSLKYVKLLHSFSLSLFSYICVYCCILCSNSAVPKKFYFPFDAGSNDNPQHYLPSLLNPIKQKIKSPHTTLYLVP